MPNFDQKIEVKRPLVRPYHRLKLILCELKTFCAGREEGPMAASCEESSPLVYKKRDIS